MFSFARPDAAQIKQLLERGAGPQPACPDLLRLRDGVAAGRKPLGFSHDISLSRIGKGEADFERARQALQAWREFDLGWVRVVNPDTLVRVGELVGVEAHTAGLWSLNLSRITDAVDTPHRYGFLYATTDLHVEEGQERFVIEFDQASGRVL